MIRLQLRNHTDSLELIVSDNGIGLPDHLLNEGLENPTTLGLKLVISLVGQIRGDLSATSDEGTTFTITLPVNDED
mgnify:FL=1